MARIFRELAAFWRLAVFSCIICLLVSCAATVQGLRKTSTPSRPKWIETLPVGDNNLYFLGIKTSAASLEEGQAAALKNSMSKISDYLGTRVESLFEDTTTNVEQKLRQQISTKSSATIHGANVVDWYYEKKARMEGGNRLEEFDVYVLVMFSREEASKELQRQKKEKYDRVMNAYDYYTRGMNSENQFEYKKAFELYQAASSTLADIVDIIELDSREIKNSDDLRRRIISRLQGLTSKMSQVSISINIKGLGQSSSVFQSNLAAGFNELGFTITDRQPFIKITGTVNVFEGNYISELKSYVYYAEGSVSALRIADEQVLAVYPFKAKGFHRIKEQAALKALEAAGTESGEKLSILLREKDAMADKY